MIKDYKVLKTFRININGIPLCCGQGEFVTLEESDAGVASCVSRGYLEEVNFQADETISSVEGEDKDDFQDVGDNLPMETIGIEQEVTPEEVVLEESIEEKKEVKVNKNKKSK